MGEFQCESMSGSMSVSTVVYIFKLRCFSFLQKCREITILLSCVNVLTIAETLSLPKVIKAVSKSN